MLDLLLLKMAAPRAVAKDAIKRGFRKMKSQVLTALVHRVNWSYMATEVLQCEQLEPRVYPSRGTRVSDLGVQPIRAY